MEKGGSVGEDCAVVSLEAGRLILSTDPVTAAAENVGHIAYHININDIATTGAAPLGIMVTILAPPKAELEDIEQVMQEISREAEKHQVMILGGHTEVTDAVNRMVVSVTAIGTMKASEKVVWTSGAKPGDRILVTKTLGLEGTSILASDFESRAQEVLSREELQEAKGYASALSVLPEGRILGSLATSMHDITEGGVLGALWEVKEASGLGFRVQEERLPFTEVTKKLCSAFGLDPLRLISSGSMLVTVGDGEQAERLLQEAGIPCAVIGEVTREGAVLLREGLEESVDPPLRDEIYRMYDETIEIGEKTNEN